MRQFRKKFLLNFPLGIFVGATIVLILAYTLDQDFSDDLKKLFTFIISAILTLLAASFALAGALNSSSTQVEIDEENRLRRLASAKANLASALNDASNKYVSLQGINHEIEIGERGQYDYDLADTQLPQEAIEGFLNVIENASSYEANYFSKILANHQVLSARWTGLQEERVSTFSRLEMSINIARQQAALNYAFEYARGAMAINTRFPSEHLASIVTNYFPGDQERVEGLARAYAIHWFKS